MQFLDIVTDSGGRQPIAPELRGTLPVRAGLGRDGLLADVRGTCGGRGR